MPTERGDDSRDAQADVTGVIYVDVQWSENNYGDNGSTDECAEGRVSDSFEQAGDGVGDTGE